MSRVRLGRRAARSRVLLALALPLAIAASLFSAPSASALPLTPGPIAQPSAAIVTPVALPTAQIDGVAWTQVIVRNTVYVGGSFTYARAAGQPAGKGRVRRYNLLSYNLLTGVLTTFAPVLNGQVRALAVSPDGTRLYVGGDFTTVSGASHQHVAEFLTTTGKVVPNFHPTVNGSVEALAATNTAVYIGGAFTEVNRAKRYRLALLGRDTAVLTRFAPEANGEVRALLVTPNHTKLIVGGAFTQINHLSASGLAAVTLSTGGKLPFAVANVVKLGSKYSGITSLTTDGTSIYGTGYVYHATVRNLEGMFSANQNTGAINWIEDCHGDTYSAYPGASAVYVVGHAHDCARVGGYPQDATVFHRALAFTKTATGHLATNKAVGYANFGGTPSPSLMNWFPDLTPGKYTGQGQAAWSVVGTGSYLALAGEFLDVNGVPQQGLTRFSLKAVSNKAIAAGQAKPQLPMISGRELAPTATYTVDANGAVSTKLNWLADWARDSETFTYTISRYDGGSTQAKTVYTTTGTSQFWNRPAMQFTDTDLLPDTQYRYRLTVSDASGSVLSDSVIVHPMS
ncbi:MAG: domain containing protein [Frankiales bacterium]|jgi:hypothetical protein|nr:domain containing protein [Frankiales bacterium]